LSSTSVCLDKNNDYFIEYFAQKGVLSCRKPLQLRRMALQSVSRETEKWRCDLEIESLARHEVSWTLHHDVTAHRMHANVLHLKELLQKQVSKLYYYTALRTDRAPSTSWMWSRLTPGTVAPLGDSQSTRDSITSSSSLHPDCLLSWLLIGGTSSPLTSLQRHWNGSYLFTHVITYLLMVLLMLLLMVLLMVLLEEEKSCRDHFREFNCFFISWNLWKTGYTKRGLHQKTVKQSNHIANVSQHRLNSFRLFFEILILHIRDTSFTLITLQRILRDSRFIGRKKKSGAFVGERNVSGAPRKTQRQ